MKRYFKSHDEYFEIDCSTDYLIEKTMTEISKTEYDNYCSSKKNVKTVGEIYSLNGTDYKVPFMKDDADGLLQVKAAFDLGVRSTNIHFTNGTVMPITATEFMDFAIWFVNKRNSFFME